MNEIKCPKCHTIFQISETDYESITKQIRDIEFNKEISLREEQYQKDKENALQLLKVDIEKRLQEDLNKKDLEINDLKNQLAMQETKQEIAIQTATFEKEKTIDDLNNKIKLNQSEFLLKEKNLKDNYEEKIRNKDEQIAYYKDFKAKQSTKMIGESLEQHCNNEFNKLRPLFKNAYFEKDNDIKTGSKGDFIFRDYDDEGTEIVSI